MADLEDAPDVVVILMPPDVEAECASIGVPLSRQKVRLTPLQRLQQRFAEESAKTGQSFLDLEFDDPDSDATPTAFFNIHHALKAHAMRPDGPHSWFGSPPVGLQSGVYRVESISALYYKAGNSPWRLQSFPSRRAL